MKKHSVLPNSQRRLLFLGGLLALGGSSLERALAAGGDMSKMHDHPMTGKDEHDHHMTGMQEHQHAPLPPGIKRSEAQYKLPVLTLVRQDGAKVAFPKELDDGRPVILDFIYTTCTTVCPVTSQIFSELQQKLGKNLAKTRLVSISIDPEFDTPARLKEYARKFHATSQWQHYTGTLEASIAVQKAFEVYRGDKMNHFPVTFLRAAPGKPWVRLEGFATPEDLAREYQGLTAAA